MNEYALILIVLIALFLLLFVWLCMIIPARMARKRGRSAFGWVVASMIFWPWAIIVLACLGDTEEVRRQKIIEDEMLRKSVHEDNSQERFFANPSGKTVNDLYRRN